jgi:hypothetical protein
LLKVGMTRNINRRMLAVSTTDFGLSRPVSLISPA